MQITLSNPERLEELCRFFRDVHALARVEGDVLTLRLSGHSHTADARHIRAYLATWLTLEAAKGASLTATIVDELE